MVQVDKAVDNNSNGYFFPPYSTEEDETQDIPQ
jgi:hypothetical protein